MRHLSQNLRTGKLHLDEVVPPSISKGQVLVSVQYSLISSGTERTKFETGRKTLIGKALARPDQVKQVVQSAQQLGLKATYEKVKTRLDSRSPLGYSAAGVVISVSPDVIDLHTGSLVACGGASAAHSEIIAVPNRLCVKVPKGVGLEAAAFSTVGAIALQGIRQADVRLGEVVAVIGLGLLGQLTVQMLKAAGCIVIGYDLENQRCELAAQLGADAASNSETTFKDQLNLLSASYGADAVLITAGTSSDRPVVLAGEISRDKGKVVIVGAVGLSIPRLPFYEKELDLRFSRSYGPGRYDPRYEEDGIDYPYGYVRWTEQRNMKAFLDLISQQKVRISPLITHKFGLEQAEIAYNLISGNSSEFYLGVLFEYENINGQIETQIEVNPRLTLDSDTVGIGVIGAGKFAQSMLLPYLKENKHVSLLNVITLSPLESRDVAERFGFHKAVSSVEDILNNKDVIAVVIATRHDSHADLVLKALLAHKSIHIEKPLAMNFDELDQIIRTYNEIGDSAFIMVGFNRRFSPMVQEAYHFINRIRTEPMAISYRINAGFIPKTSWIQDVQKGGGRIIGEVCHFVDLMQFFTGSRIEKVYAQLLPNQGKYNNDNVLATLTFEDGSVGNLLYTANGDKSLPKESLEIFTGGKVIIIDDFRRLSIWSNGKRSISTRGARDKGHKGELAAWIDAIRNGCIEPVPFAEAVISTQATLAICESISSGDVIKLR